MKYLTLSLILFLPLLSFGAERIVVAEELYQEG
jgi:hypothetical protein